MVNLVLDSNVYLHGRFFADLPWDELVDDDVCIVVPKMVLRELDQLKYGNKPESTRDRGAKVVRRLFELVKEAKAGGSTTASVRRRVQLRVLTGAPDFSSGNFDPEDQDDHVLATCIAVGGTLCTRDVGFMLRADASQVPFVELPEAWAEPTVVDPAHKELEALRNRAPKLELAIAVRDGLVGEGDLLKIAALRPPTSDEVMSVALDRTAEGERRARRHRSELQDAWYSEHGRDEERRNRDEEHFQRLQMSLFAEAERCATKGREITFTLSVRNKGTTIATAVEVDASVRGVPEIVSDRSRFLVGQLLHNRESVAGTVTVRFPRGFETGGFAFVTTVHAAELPKPLSRTTNFRVQATPAGPFEGLEPSY